MATRPRQPKLKRAKPEPKITRASVSFPHTLYETIESIAKEKKVSVAWVIRDATEKYVADQWPLLESWKAHGKA